MKTARDVLALCAESKTFLDKYTYRGADCVLKSVRLDATKDHPNGYTSYVASCPDLGLSSKVYDTIRAAKGDLHPQIDASIKDRDSNEAVDFSKHIKVDGGKKHLAPAAPLFASMAVSDLMDMTGIEIRKLWTGLPTNVFYNLGAFFSEPQLQALTKHPDKSIAKDAQDALTDWG